MVRGQMEFSSTEPRYKSLLLHITKAAGPIKNHIFMIQNNFDYTLFFSERDIRGHAEKE